MLIVENEKNSVKRRTKGERTRHQILEATIKILAKNGIKGTTHRAIAKEADIQLSLTTYYFKDIEALILQAIVLNSEITLNKTDACWINVFKLIEGYEKADLRKVSVKQLLADQITKILTDKCISRLEQQSNELSVEQILFSQTHISPALIDLAEQHKETLIEPYVKLCRYFNKKSARLDAEILFTQLKQLEYRLLAYTIDNDKRHEIESLISRIFALIFKLKS